MKNFLFSKSDFFMKKSEFLKKLHFWKSAFSWKSGNSCTSDFFMKKYEFLKISILKAPLSPLRNGIAILKVDIRQLCGRDQLPVKNFEPQAKSKNYFELYFTKYLYTTPRV